MIEIISEASQINIPHKIRGKLVVKYDDLIVNLL